MKCVNCGSELLPDDTFCGNCGAKTEPYTGAVNSQTAAADFNYDAQNNQNYPGEFYNDVPSEGGKTAEGKRIPGIIPVLLIILIIAILGFVVFNIVVIKSSAGDSRSSPIYNYKQSLLSFLNISNDSEAGEDYESESSTTYYGRFDYQTTQDYSYTSSYNVYETTTDLTREQTSSYYSYNYENDDYLFPSDREIITYEYLDTKSDYEIDLIKNEIYARHGYIFRMSKFYDYFIQKSWYHPTEPDMDKASEDFSDIEWENIDIIVKYQNR